MVGPHDSSRPGRHVADPDPGEYVKWVDCKSSSHRSAGSFDNSANFNANDDVISTCALATRSATSDFSPNCEVDYHPSVIHCSIR